MAKKNQNTEATVDEFESAVGKGEKFVLDNWKNILYILIAFIVILAAIMGYRYYSHANNLKAQDAIYPAQQLFEQGDYEQALAEFETVIDDFGSTATGNTARAYAGLCNKELGNYDEAIRLLKDFSGDDAVLAPAILAALGDCYVDSETPDYAKAADSFEKAAQASNSAQYSPLYLRKAGLAYEKLGQKDRALKVYETIQQDWYETTVGQNIDKYIERVK